MYELNPPRFSTGMVFGLSESISEDVETVSGLVDSKLDHIDL